MIEFKKVEKVWPNGKHVLKDINLKINAGEFVAVIGLSGAGKTTLLKTINKINNISSGEIFIDINENEKYEINKTKGKSLRNLRKHIGLMSQEYNNIEKQTVLKNVLNSRVAQMNFFRAMACFFTKEEKQNALAALEKLNLLEFSYIRADNLSGGQQQRVALARTINQNPKIIIADEPVSALDPILANRVMEDFKKINSELNITVIINIHHVDLALKYCDRIIGLKDGEIVFDGDPKKLNESKLEEIYGK
ncbi:Phosphonate ABC transporter ATP-binding protein [Mesoplasma florum W37]|uniref:Phosphonate ABC transporter ATP-binding protein n=1 Tax=Mesoplasma florum TaxID=2151 RepID=A0AAD0MNH2_MESFO|nr:phosphonate ABC transporter ATP-binding protein [Mesoplasma florum]AGY41686.1 Phosphonate ABC transporter ATP-binding protein [Mesoplasma florum W37]AVN59890.1 phosphonate ABC transporter ATP-binding protein [Mesoplasma florum]AVN66025.1 Phosphonate ABC transporter ATP-binding protein [Mesoplasma florum]